MSRRAQERGDPALALRLHNPAICLRAEDLHQGSTGRLRQRMQQVLLAPPALMHMQILSHHLLPPACADAQGKCMQTPRPLPLHLALVCTLAMVRCKTKQVPVAAPAFHPLRSRMPQTASQRSMGPLQEQVCMHSSRFLPVTQFQ